MKAWVGEIKRASRDGLRVIQVVRNALVTNDFINIICAKGL